MNRLIDDQSQARIHAEAIAVNQILRLVADGRIDWVGSAVLVAEARRNPDIQRRQDIQSLLRFANESAPLAPEAIIRAKDLESLGYGAFDALHIACAESAGVEALLTTDDGMVKKAGRKLGGPQIRIVNPVSWLQEILP